MVAADPELMVLLPAADADLCAERRADRDPAHHGRLPWLYGSHSLCGLLGSHRLRPAPTAERAAHQPPVASIHRRSRSIWLGSGTFVRGDPQRGLCHGRRKAPYARRQFASGSQSGNAICVRSLYRVFPPLYGAARQTRGTAFFLGTDRREQSKAAEEASLRTVFSALHQTDQKEGLSL